MFEDIGLEDEIIPYNFTPLNKTIDDEFMNNLCLDGETSDYRKNGVNVDDVLYSTFNPTIHWKKQKQVLGMRVENQGKHKSMLMDINSVS